MLASGTLSSLRISAESDRDVHRARRERWALFEEASMGLTSKDPGEYSKAFTSNV